MESHLPTTYVRWACGDAVAVGVRVAALTIGLVVRSFTFRRYWRLRYKF